MEYFPNAKGPDWEPGLAASQHGEPNPEPIQLSEQETAQLDEAQKLAVAVQDTRTLTLRGTTFTFFPDGTITVNR